MATSRNVALVSSSFAPYSGGVEEHVRQLAKHLVARGNRVAVWTVDRGEHLGLREVDGIAVHYLPSPLPARSFRSLVRYAAELPAAVSAWVRAYRSLRPTLLNVHCFGPNGVYGLVTSRLAGCRLVVSSHGETFADDHNAFRQSALLRAALRRSLRKADAVSGCSTVVVQDLRTRFGLTQGVVVPNGIDLDEVPDPRKPAWWPEEGPVVFAAGRLEHNKGFDLLMRAFAVLLLGRRIPATANLVVAGDGSMLGDLEGLAHELGIASSVTMPGRLERAALAGAMNSASVVVVPSRVEAFGIVALEAWRGGAPLVMTTRGGARDFAEDGVNALLIDPEDVPRLADAVARILTDPELSRRLVDAASARVRQYSWERITDSYAAIYEMAESRPATLRMR